MRWPDYSLSVSGLSGSIELEGRRMLIKDLRGEVNQGRLSIGGSLDWHGLGLSGADVQITADSVLTDYPRGFLAEWDLALRFTSDGRRQKLDGKASLIQGNITENFDVRSGLFRLLKGSGTRVYFERSPFFDNMTFDVDITTVNPFNVRNNIADIQVRGLSSSAENHTLRVSEEASWSWTEELSLLPETSTGSSRAGSFPQSQPHRTEFGPPGCDHRQRVRDQAEHDREPWTTCRPRSHPSRPCPRPTSCRCSRSAMPLHGAAPSSSNGLPDQALSYLESAVTGKVGKVIAKGLGLDTLTLDTRLVAPGGTPEARITVGQHLTPNVDLILSQNLQELQPEDGHPELRADEETELPGSQQRQRRVPVQRPGELRIGRALPAPARLSGPLPKRDSRSAGSG